MTIATEGRWGVAFQPAAQAVDVELTLIADEPPDRDGKIAQVWSVPPAGIEPATHGLGNRLWPSMPSDKVGHSASEQHV